MDEMIDFLRNSTQLARFSRGEVRDFLERLEIEGYSLVKMVVDAPEPVKADDPAPVVEPEPVEEHPAEPVAEEPAVVETSAS